MSVNYLVANGSEFESGWLGGDFVEFFGTNMRFIWSVCLLIVGVFAWKVSCSPRKQDKRETMHSICCHLLVTGIDDGPSLLEKYV